MSSSDDDDETFWAWVASLLILNNRRRHEDIARWLESRWRADWRSLDFADLRGSTEIWLEQAYPDVERAWGRVQLETAGFLDDFLFARAMQSGDPVPDLIQAWVDRPLFTDGAFLAPQIDRGRVTAALVSSGPGAVFSSLPAPESKAMGDGFTSSLGIAVAEAMNGGSELFRAVAKRKPSLVKGWQRITDGDPCAFCALLASRGPVYQDLSRIADTHVKWQAYSKLESADNGARVHSNCKCTLIPVYKNGGEELAGWSKVADDIWFGRVPGYGKTKDGKTIADLVGVEARRFFAREYSRYRKNHPDMPDEGEASLRRQVEAVFDSNAYVDARQKAVIRSALSG